LLHCSFVSGFFGKGAPEVGAAGDSFGEQGCPWSAAPHPEQPKPAANPHVASDAAAMDRTNDEELMGYAVVEFELLLTQMDCCSPE
jgi:hypothetical protein